MKRSKKRAYTLGNEFSSLLAKARDTVGSRVGHTISQQFVATALGISRSEYATWESGERPSFEHVEGLAEFYAAHPDFVKNLRAEYKKQFIRKPVSSVEVILEATTKRRRALWDVSDHIREYRLTFEALYEAGHASEALKRTIPVWNKMKEFWPTERETLELGIQCARFYSQAERHLEARDILSELSRIAFERNEEYIKRKVYVRICIVRRRLTDSWDPVQYYSFLSIREDRLEKLSPMHPSEDPDWGDTWLAYSLEPLTAATEGLQRTDLDFISEYWPLFEQQVGHVASPNGRRAFDLATIRFRSFLCDPVEALNLANASDRAEDSFSFALYNAQSRFIALTRASLEVEADREESLWVEKCRDAGMKHKARWFRTARRKMIFLNGFLSHRWGN